LSPVFETLLAAHGATKLRAVASKINISERGWAKRLAQQPTALRCREREPSTIFYRFLQHNGLLKLDGPLKDILEQF
jgi:hypothetical protein